MLPVGVSSPIKQARHDDNSIKANLFRLIFPARNRRSILQNAKTQFSFQPKSAKHRHVCRQSFQRLAIQCIDKCNIARRDLSPGWTKSAFYGIPNRLHVAPRRTIKRNPTAMHNLQRQSAGHR